MNPRDDRLVLGSPAHTPLPAMSRVGGLWAAQVEHAATHGLFVGRERWSEQQDV